MTPRKPYGTVRIVFSTKMSFPSRSIQSPRPTTPPHRASRFERRGRRGRENIHRCPACLVVRFGRASMKWVTREKAKVDRIACPWLVTKFIDPKAEFLFVTREKVLDVAKQEGAIPYDSPGAELFHYKEGGDERCSFDAIIKKYKLADPALLDMAEIVRTADAAPRTRRPEGAGLEAMALGFRANAKDDFENMRLQFPAYDALYAYCKLKVEGKAKLEHTS